MLSFGVDLLLLIYYLQLLSGSSEYEPNPAIEYHIGQHSTVAQPMDVNEIRPF